MSNKDMCDNRTGVSIDSIDVAIPAYKSASVIEESLDALKTALDIAEVNCNKLLIDLKPSGDETESIIREWADKNGWNLDLQRGRHDLPAARQNLIERVTTNWFFFLDDDVRVAPDYFERLCGTIASEVGAVQGRKKSSQVHPSRWVKNRSNRGGTHATLVRHSAVSGIEFPEDLSVLEDEYLRQTTESEQYLWIFNHQAQFSHQNQDRHPMGWEEGFLAGYYELKTPGEVIFLIPYEVAVGGPLLPRLKRAGGFIYGHAKRKWDSE